MTDTALLEEIKKMENVFAQVIRERMGIVIHTHQLKDLEKALFNACQLFKCSPNDYLDRLIKESTDSLYYESLITRITVGETYFFRDKHQMQLLETKLLPNIIARKRQLNDLSLRIWSAGCASGEEIYTIAMLLFELILDQQKWSLHLLGTDINTNSLKKALHGTYGEWSMRSIPAPYKNKYFIKENQHYKISDKIREAVSFSYLNLNENNFPSMITETNAQDLILCRNVLIYFDTEKVNRLMTKLSDCLNDGGYLLLGASDPINAKNTTLTHHFHDSSLFSRTLEAVPKPPAILVREPVKPFIYMKTQPQKTEPKAKAKETTYLASDGIKQINELLAKEHWQSALGLIQEYELKGTKTAFLMSAKALVCANLGKLTEAIELCEKNLKLEPTNINTYFILAMALMELNHFEESVTAFKKVIYLDYQFVVAHYQLGLLLLRNKQGKLGLKYLNNALLIAKKKDPMEIVRGVQQLPYSRLVDILEHEVELHTATKEQSDVY